MKQGRGINYRVWLEQIVKPSIPSDRLYRELVIETEATKLADALEESLNILSSEQPPPSTSAVWESALGEWSRLRPKPGLNSADLEYRAFAHHMRQLPNPLLRAFLVARCPVRAPRLRRETRERLLFHLDTWQASRNVDDNGYQIDAHNYGFELLRKDSLAADGEWYEDNDIDLTYPSGYRSPRELELDRIMYDRDRSREERQRAADEIARIEWKRIEDNAKRTVPFLSYSQPDPPRTNGQRKRGQPYKFNPRNPCQKHDIRGCSRCHPRRNRDRNNLTTEYEALAKQEGYGVGVLKEPFGRGRLSAAEQLRYEALVRVVAKLYEQDYTQETIGAALGRDRKSVSKLVQASRSKRDTT
jgi:hypothetical protein